MSFASQSARPRILLRLGLAGLSLALLGMARLSVRTARVEWEGLRPPKLKPRPASEVLPKLVSFFSRYLLPAAVSAHEPESVPAP